MKRILAAVIVAAALSGCAALSGPGATVADDIRTSAEFALCKAITVGAWVRQYGADPAKADAWKTLCSDTATQTPAATSVTRTTGTTTTTGTVTTTTAPPAPIAK